MAMDQAVFEHATDSGIPLARFYHWSEPAETVGYFHQFPESPTADLRPVRRFTGGGKVEHGNDSTFLLAIPNDSAVARLSGEDRYRWVHSALAAALNAHGIGTRLESSPTPSGMGPCFTTPVTWDLLCSESGVKIGGGAQRRSAGAVMHQGSVRLPLAMQSPDALWIQDFLSNLATTVSPMDTDTLKAITVEGTRWAADRFSTNEWNKWHETVKA